MTGTCNGAGGGGPGTSYSFAELEGLWVNAGGPVALAPTAAAIALAESGGCSTDLNPTDNGGLQTSWGLWQISNGTHSQPGPNWNTGAGNAALAVAKWKGGGFSPWGTYDSGAYKKFLNGSPPAPDTSVSGGADATLTAADSTPDCLISFPTGKVLFIESLGSGCALSKSEARALIGTGIMVNGALILVVGALILAAFGLRSSGAGRAAGRGLEIAGAATAVAGADRAAVRLHSAGGRVRSQGAGRAATSAAAGASRRRISAQQAAAAAQARQQAAARRQAQRAAQQPRGRHAKTGPNSPRSQPGGRPG
jgi:hypothetical protein